MPSFARLLPAAAFLVALLTTTAPLSGAATDSATPSVPLVATIDDAIDTASTDLQSVIVRATEGRGAAVRAAIQGAGGRVVADLPIVDGVEALVPGSAVRSLSASTAVHSVSDNAVGTFEEYSYDDTTTASSFARTSGATAAWARGLLGRGVGVAVLDTGVSPMRDFGGRLVHGPDLSGEGTTVDSYGHGTVMAGIIAGGGDDSATRGGGAFTGVAPKATIVAVKTAGRNGVVDVSTILQAMHWVSAYADQFNIRVVSLSWGTTSTQHHSVDPLNYAVQRLWREGIVVVVAAGNSGPKSGTVTKPGDDPMVITVGGYDDKQNLDPTDDSLSPWSSRGPTAAGVRKPDLVAPARTLVAARSYGSQVEVENRKALVEPSYIKGSGTSQAAALVAGLAALIVERDPSLTPDQVKQLLRSTATPIAGVAGNDQGAGRVGVDRTFRVTPDTVEQVATSTGLGSLELSRGGRNVQTDCGGDGAVEVIVGEIDVRCERWDPLTWTGNAWTGNAWTGNAWTGNAWTGGTWTGNAWTGGTWTGNAWTGNAWTGNAWTGNAWTGNAWTGSTWTSAAWSGNAWTGNAWTTAEYEEDAEFMTAWWGNNPPRRLSIPGEVAAEDVEQRPGPRPNVGAPSGVVPPFRPVDNPLPAVAAQATRRHF